MRPDKLGSILKLLREALQADKVQQRVLKTLYGKLEHIRGLVPNSKFHIGKIVKASSVSEDLKTMVLV